MPEEILNTPQPTESQSTDWPKVILAAVLGLGLLFSAAYAGYYYGVQQIQQTPRPEADRPLDETPVVSQPTLTPEPTPTPTSTLEQEDGVDLEDIKYELPQGWEAKLGDESLLISPVEGGGFLSIRVYNYPEDVGRREYYCQVSNVCIEGVSYFTEMSIGNISGYVANALDNSGGGAEYFGAKGNKFYIISSYNPPSPNEFENNYKNVLNSLIF